MAIFGISVEPSGESGTAANVIILQRYLAPQSGNLESVQCFTKSFNEAWSELIFLMYADNSGVPGALLGQSAAFYSLPDNVMGVRSADLVSPVAVLNTVPYWVGLQVEHDSTYVASEADVLADAWRYYDSPSFGTIPPDLAALGGLVDETRFGFYATYAETAPVIVSINDGTISPGEASDLVAANFVIESLTIGTLDVDDFVNVDDDNYTFTMPPFADGYYPPFGTVEAEATGGADSDTIDVTLVLAAGWSSVVLATLSTDPDSIPEAVQAELTVKVANTFYALTAGITLYDDGTFSDASAGTISVWNRDVDTNVMTEIFVINGVVVSQSNVMALTALPPIALPVTALALNAVGL